MGCAGDVSLRSLFKSDDKELFEILPLLLRDIGECWELSTATRSPPKSAYSVNMWCRSGTELVSMSVLLSEGSASLLRSRKPATLR